MPMNQIGLRGVNKCMGCTNTTTNLSVAQYPGDWCMDDLTTESMGFGTYGCFCDHALADVWLTGA